LNKQIVGDVTARVGARPSTGGPGAPLPKNYKSVANKVTMAMVAMPVALVTSWVLYERCESFAVPYFTSFCTHEGLLTMGFYSCVRRRQESAREAEDTS
jgi:hypothetical protein